MMSFRFKVLHCIPDPLLEIKSEPFYFHKKILLCLLQQKCHYPYRISQPFVFSLTFQAPFLAFPAPIIFNTFDTAFVYLALINQAIGNNL